MYWLYRSAVFLYGLGIRLAALWQPKARLWLEGRKRIWDQLADIPPGSKVVWFHTASLGEFEQGRPLIEHYRKLHPDYFLLLTFFSPSGFTPRKNYAYVDKVCYLPLDHPAASRRFFDLVRPSLIVFVKYEFWYHYFREASRRNIPLILVSARFRANQLFFQPLSGAFWRKIPAMASHIFVQDRESADLLQSIGIEQVTVNSDTRFDRVLQVKEEYFRDERLEAFCMGKTIIAGSSWPVDEQLLLEIMQRKELKAWKLILVPHDLRQDHLTRLSEQLGSSGQRYADQPNPKTLAAARFLILDTVGMLSKVYRYGEIAYVGGGFGKGIHNTLEAAVYGLPVLFGPEHAKFLEAADLIALGAGFEVRDVQTMGNRLVMLAENEVERTAIAGNISAYFQEKRGATDRILSWMEQTALG